MEIGRSVVLKVQVLATGRGKAGGVRFADSPDQAEQVAREMLGMQIKATPSSSYWLRKSYPSPRNCTWLPPTKSGRKAA